MEDQNLSYNPIMGKIKFIITSFIGIKVSKLRFPSDIDMPKIKEKYKKILPELATTVRSYFYLATSPKPEVAYVRNLENIPDLYPLVTYPGDNANGYGTIINMVGLYINELKNTEVEIEPARKIIKQSLINSGISFKEEEIEIIVFMSNLSFDPNSDLDEEIPHTIEDIL